MFYDVCLVVCSALRVSMFLGCARASLSCVLLDVLLPLLIALFLLLCLFLYVVSCCSACICVLPRVSAALV